MIAGENAKRLTAQGKSLDFTALENGLMSRGKSFAED